MQGASYTASLPPGVHAVSNGPLGNPWPKTERMKALLSSHLLPFLRSPRASDDLDTMDLDEMADRVFREVLWDTELCHDEARLPRTGLGIAVERILSPICIEPTRTFLPTVYMQILLPTYSCPNDSSHLYRGRFGCRY